MKSPSKGASRSKARQRRRRRAQNEIVEKAMDLFAVKGYEATTVDAIASAALISSRTFYRYFPAKEDLVFHGFPDSVALLRREAGDGNGDLFDRLRRASVTLAGVLEIDRDAWIRRFELILSVPSLRARDVVMNERYEDVFREAMLEEWGDGETAKRRSRLLAGAVMGGIQTAIKMWVESDGQPSLPSLASTVFDALGEARPTSLRVSVPPAEAPGSVEKPASDSEDLAMPAERRRAANTGMIFLD